MFGGNKYILKRTLARDQERHCALSGQELPIETSEFDLDRTTDRREGGGVEEATVVHPVAHMQKHGNYRERDPELEHLKSMLDGRRNIMKLMIDANNKLLAYQRQTDHPDPESVDFLQSLQKDCKSKLKSRDRDIAKYVREMDNALAQAALSVKAIGPITVAYCLCYIEIATVFPDHYPGTNTPHPRAGQEKAPHASSVWAYAGLDKPGHQRYQKGVAGGGNKQLRTVLFTMAESQVKQYGPYRDVYDDTKFRLQNSDKLVETRNTQGQLVNLPWKETKPSHRHGAALRKIMKHFLADYWFVGRVVHGLPATPLYPEAVLGGNHRTIKPEERGWIY